MREFLVCHDYGMGGLWWWITAPSAETIQSAFRDVIVFDVPPDWWSDELDAIVRHVQLDDPDDTGLNELRR
ncbi:hypothetical protein ACETK8_07900 [Brevundimonas staleyi]|uniref:Uncharacterized protein n=1 Tax=Brevundimonas staleyi TaxID=74326 RepID=A0ABW0FNV8_9CAUL